jgi:chemosensory pili system protein ChpA (sensor histidine kinase/response regulator)
MSIDSTPGQGVHFRIRLPFTVSVNRALMVQCGRAVRDPAQHHRRPVRVPPHELEGHYQQDPPHYDYAGQRYELCYLGELLHTVARPTARPSLPLPVLLVHARPACGGAGRRHGGSREIVVKSLGRSSPGCRACPGRPFWAMAAWC